MSKQKFPKPTPVLEFVHSDGADQGKVAKELGEVAAYPEKVGVEPGKIGAELLKVPGAELWKSRHSIKLHNKFE